MGLFDNLLNSDNLRGELRQYEKERARERNRKIGNAVKWGIIAKVYSDAVSKEEQRMRDLEDIVYGDD